MEYNSSLFLVIKCVLWPVSITQFKNIRFIKYTLYNIHVATRKGNSHYQFDEPTITTNLSQFIKTGHVLPLIASNNSKCARKDVQQ